MDGQSAKRPNGYRVFTIFQILMGPIFLAGHFLSGHDRWPGGVWIGLFIACALSGMGVVMLLTSRKR